MTQALKMPQALKMTPSMMHQQMKTLVSACNIIYIVIAACMCHSMHILCNRYSTRPSVMKYIQARARGQVAMHVYCTCYNYITTTPYLPCVIIKI